MKSRSLIIAFLPLIVFSLLSRVLPHNDIGVAGLVAALTALAALATTRPVWPPKIITACSLVVFAVIAALGFTLGTNDDRWLATWGGAGIGVIIGLIILALIPIMPFTEQFARERVPASSWGSPIFKQINLVLSAAWGGAIVAAGASRVAAAAINGHTTRRLPDILLGTVIPVLIIIYMLKFSKAYPDRVAHQQPTQPAVGH
jgi:hypothetical protein